MNDRSELMRNLGLAAVVAAVAVLKWDLFQSFLVFGVTLGILVAVHEWGHYIAAKAVGARVYEFAIGMGPKLVTYMRRHETEYTLRALPLGGFVNIKGMQPDDEITPDGLNGKRAAERALVYLAGPLMNIVFGVPLVLLMGFMFGIPDESVVLVGSVSSKKPAEKMQVVSVNGAPATNHRPGLRVGDRILEVDGTVIREGADVSDLINPKIGQPVTLKVNRKGQTLVLTGVTTSMEQTTEAPVVTRVDDPQALPLKPGDIIIRVNGRSPAAIAPNAPTYLGAVQTALQQVAGQPVTIKVWRNGNIPTEVKGTAVPVRVETQTVNRRFGVLGFSPIPGSGKRVSIGESVTRGFQGLQNFATGLLGMATKPKVLSENVGGPVKIFEVLSHTTDLPPVYYLQHLATLSLSLAIFNLIPIPVLDGGHMLILTVEVLRRKRLSADSQKVALMVGLAIIGVIFVLIMQKDLSKFF